MTFFAQNEAFGQWINSVAQSSGISPNVILFVLLVIVVWSTVWKLLGMWKSARKGSWIWFIVLALTNTVGILPILYIYVFSKVDWKKFVGNNVRNKNNLRKKTVKKNISKKKVKRKKR